MRVPAQTRQRDPKLFPVPKQSTVYMTDFWYLKFFGVLAQEVLQTQYWKTSHEFHPTLKIGNITR